MTKIPAWNWGGNLVVHQVVQQPNGELTVRVPRTVINAFNKPVSQILTTDKSNSIGITKDVEIKAPGIFSAVTGEKMPVTCKISTIAEFTNGTRDFGCMLRCDDELEKSYYIRLEPAKNRLVFDQWPRPVGEVNHIVELERMVDLKSGTPVTIQIFVDGTKGVVYINNSVAMNFRAYDIAEGKWGLFVTDGNVHFKNIELATI